MPTRREPSVLGINWFEAVAFSHDLGRPLALFFDYDGTLSPIVAHPSLAIFPEPFRRLFHQFQQLDTVELGFASGRALADLQKMVNVKPAYYSGSGGLEIDLQDRILQHESITLLKPTLERIQHQLQPILERNPYTWIETKPGALTIHYRGLPPLTALCFRQDVERVLAQQTQIRWRVVSEAVEISPMQGWHKGDAVELILQHIQERHPADWLPIYFGNASNDEEGMQAVLDKGGITVGIGPESPDNSQYRLPNPETLKLHLEELLKRLT